MRALALGLLAGCTLAASLPLPALELPVHWSDGLVRALAAALRAAGVSCVLLAIFGAHTSRSVRVAALCAGLIAGLLSTSSAIVSASRSRLPDALARVDLVATGRIVSVPTVAAGRVAFDLAIEHIECAAALECWSERLKLRRIQLAQRGTAPAYRSGERWRLAVRLKPPYGLANDGGFDRERHSILRRIDARGQIRVSPPPRRLDGTRIGRPGAVASLRETLRDRLASLPAADEWLPVIEALTLGITDGIDRPTRERLRATGTAHLLAISGLHVGLVAGFAFGLARVAGTARRRLRVHFDTWAEQRLGRDAAESPFPRRPPSIAAWAPSSAAPALTALGLAAAYALVAGFGLPTQRALVVIAVVAVATLRQRHVAPGSALSLALVVVLVGDPLAPLGAGFWLSFGTVALIAWLHGGRRRRSGSTGLLSRSSVSFVAALRTHALLGVALLPLGAWFFQQGSLVAPFANLVAVPAVGLVIVPLALAALLLSWPVPEVASVALGLAERATGTLFEFLELFGAAAAIAPVMTLPGVFLLATVLAALALLTSPARGRPLALVSCLLLPAILHNVRGPRLDGFELHVLDVGQGLAVLVLTPHATVLFDTGGRFGDRDMLEAAVLPHLAAAGRRRIDVLVVSHSDEDHSAGLASAAARFPSLSIYASDVAAARAALGAAGTAAGTATGTATGPPASATSIGSSRTIPTPRPCIAGEGFEFDGVRFEFLHPAAHDRGSDNDRSCVLLVYAGESRVLLTGDIEARGEARLVERVVAEGRGLPVDVLVAPHHGSDTSSGAAFVAAFPARHVVFPAGRANAWGFPHDSVQMRYKSRGTQGHTTGMSGALVFRFGRAGLGVPSDARPVALFDVMSDAVPRAGPDTRSDSGPGSWRPDTWRHGHRRLWRLAPETLPDQRDCHPKCGKS